MCRGCCEYTQVECTCPGNKALVGYSIPCCRNENNECDPCLIHLGCSVFENCKACHNGTWGASLDDFYVKGSYCSECRAGWFRGDCMGCGGVLSSSKGQIVLEGYPFNAHCEWTVRVRPGFTVEIRFDMLSLEFDHMCKYDFLEVRDGDNVDSGVIAKVCGNERPAPIRSTGNSLHVLFTSDGSKNYDGFYATFSEITACSSSPCFHDGTCILDKSNSFRCACLAGYTGKHCEFMVMCRNPGAPSNGIMKGTDFRYGCQVFFSCNPGYKLKGSHVAYCQLDGNWSPSVPQCDPVEKLQTCAQPGIPLHGYMTTIEGTGRIIDGHATVGTVLQFTCNSSYQLTGSDHRICLKDGQWTGDHPTCVKVPAQKIQTCPQPGIPMHGYMEALAGTGRMIDGHATVGTVLQFTCNNSYDLTGSDHRICLKDGQWTGKQPVCVKVPGEKLQACLVTDVPVHGYMETVEGTGHITDNYATAGTVLRFACNNSYQLSGSQHRMCLKDGHWTGKRSVCVKVLHKKLPTCPDPGAPVHGYMETVKGTGHIGDGYATAGTVVQFACIYSYILIGNDHRICLKGGQWTGKQPVCVKGEELQSCPEPGKPMHGYMETVEGTGHIIYGFATAGTVIQFTCNDTYMLVGSEHRICLKDGQWTGMQPVCVRVPGEKLKNCPELAVPMNGYIEVIEGMGHITDGDAAVGTVVEFGCNNSYILAGSGHRMCLKDGQWTGKQPVCVKVPGEKLPKCTEPEIPEHGYMETIEGTGSIINGFAPAGTVIQFACNDTYILEGNEQRICLKDGQWTGKQPACVKVQAEKLQNCPELSIPENGYLEIMEGTGLITNDQATVGTVIQFTCNNSYVLTGSKQRMCLQDGQWTGKQPVCDKVPEEKFENCPVPVIPVHGYMEVLNGTGNIMNGFATFGSVIQFACNNSYTLVGNEQSICQKDGQWTSKQPICEKVPEEKLENCPEPVIPVHGYMEVLKGTGNIINGFATVGTVIQFACNSSYTLVGNEQSICQKDGQWTSKQVCEKVPEEKIENCPEPVIPVHGYMEVLKGTGNIINGFATVGTVIQFACNSSYTLVGNEQSICQKEGEWTSRQPICEKELDEKIFHCLLPGIPTHGYMDILEGTGLIKSGYATSGTVISFVCNNSYVPSGSEERICQEDGQWTGKQPICVKGCKEPKIPELLRQKVLPLYIPSRMTSLPVPYSAIFTKKTYEIYPTKKTVLPIMEVAPGYHNLHTQLEYDCISQFYQRTGSKRRTCLKTGKWSGRPPKCSPICGRLQNFNLPKISESRWPWLAAIYQKRKQISNESFKKVVLSCSGALLNERTVVVAAHCVTEPGKSTVINAAEIRVVLGKFYRHEHREEKNLQTLQIAAVLVHPNYDPAVLDSDIAVLKLLDKAKISDLVQPICLPSGDDFDSPAQNMQAMITGWKITSDDRDPDSKNDTVRIGTIEIGDSVLCEQQYEEHKIPVIVTDNMFCAKQHMHGISNICPAETGGIAMLPTAEKPELGLVWNLIGLVSWGYDSPCSPELYTGFTKVTPFKEWLEKNMK
ncbi:inactive serine protease PAMR1 isoform X2 [Protopterus annectens]|nr:inactive serine protease PAMR1 isoform X2 [Protopterus annectens]